MLSYFMKHFTEFVIMYFSVWLTRTANANINQLVFIKSEVLEVIWIFCVFEQQIIIYSIYLL